MYMYVTMYVRFQLTVKNYKMKKTYIDFTVFPIFIQVRGIAILYVTYMSIFIHFSFTEHQQTLIPFFQFFLIVCSKISVSNDGN